ncbi:terminase small subunit [Candidatus Latescibacterota bacterium]
MNFTLKQQRFCEEYLVDLNATQAAIRAGYSEHTAQEQGSQNLSKLIIQEEIQKKIKKRSERTEITSDMIVVELAKIGFANMSDYVKWNTSGITLKDSTKLSLEQSVCVSEVSETKTKNGGSVKIKLHDKKGALELLGRHLGMFTDKQEHVHSMTPVTWAELAKLATDNGNNDK